MRTRARGTEPSTKTSAEGASTGASDGGTGPASDRWLPLDPSGPPLVRDEDALVGTLRKRGFLVNPAGSRYQSYDLEITQDPRAELPIGKYEVKRLSISKGAIDRRFKVGSRSERIYGHRDSEIKAAALQAEHLMDQPRWYLQLGVADVDLLHETIDMAKLRRHGRRFDERFSLAISSLTRVPVLASPKGFGIYREFDRYLKGAVTDQNIAEGFSDIAGIFLIVGANYTLVKAGELGRFISFDSVSAEGVKLRYNGQAPTTGVVGSETGRRPKDEKKRTEKKR